ncbi:MAG: hypothetical protein QXY49_07030 [Thermofilaceae archaeon]
MEGLTELRELAMAVTKAAEAFSVIKKKTARHVIRGEAPKLQRVIMTVEAGSRKLELTDKQIAALLALKGSGGAEVLNTIARLTGLNSRLGLGLVMQLKDMNLVTVVETPQRRIVLLTPLGWEVVEKAEKILSARV